MSRSADAGVGRDGYAIEALQRLGGFVKLNDAATGFVGLFKDFGGSTRSRMRAPRLLRGAGCRLDLRSLIARPMRDSNCACGTIAIDGVEAVP